MKACCVEGCSGPATPNPVYFQFPSRRLLRKRWLDAIKCPEAEAGAAVCIRHFAPADYELVRGQATLRSRSVPSRRIGGGDNEESEDSESDTSHRSQNANDRIPHNDNGDNRKPNNENENEKDGDNSKTDDQLQNRLVEEVTADKANIKNNGRRQNSEKSGKTNDKKNYDVNVNEKVSDDNFKVNDDNDNVTDDNKTVNEDNGKGNKDTEEIKDDNGKGKNDNENAKNDNENANDGNGKVNDDNGKGNKDTEDIKDHNGKVNDDNGKGNKDTEDIKDDNGKGNNDNENANDGIGKVNDSIKVNDDNGSVKLNDDNGNLNKKKVQGRKTRCKITALRAINGRRKFSSSSDSDCTGSSPRPDVDGSKEDIEESLQHYYIENKKTERQVAAMADVINEQQERISEESRKIEEERGEAVAPSAPVFIELSVGQGSTTGGPAESDCLMVMESVQCEVDPTLLLAAREEDEEVMEQVDLLDDDDDDDELQVVEKKREDPISLLTSSDEDDVIIQEPKYDVVDVSSADTSEDDMPLVKLVKQSGASSDQTDAKKMKLSAKHTKKLITKLLWDDFYCVHCRFTSKNAAEYTKHMATHSTVLQETQPKIIQYCQECGFTTSSKHQMQKHRQRHKNEKKFKCQKCNYSAKHKMSLVYHMKTHKNSGLNEVELAICGTYEPTGAKIGKSKKSKASDSDKKYKCNGCAYNTDRRSDLRRHRRRLHSDSDNDDDEYIP